MSKIKQLLQLYKKGESKRSIAQILGISRNTVRAISKFLPSLHFYSIFYSLFRFS
ncbi:helix-turn-helix domain-containing protein [Membranihabitans marinus]|uniref:helix-turn-helix domain-containing protein n=1 Tax=Membranihabitans marinus TaxID=1227546 RepID=UPI001F36402C|nr:helix-turn-helix domain-containing protein [Membranihabitans marinus]